MKNTHAAREGTMVADPVICEKCGAELSPGDECIVCAGIHGKVIDLMEMLKASLRNAARRRGDDV